MKTDAETLREQEYSDHLVMAFAPIHKRAFGVSVGVAFGTLLLIATVYARLRGVHPPILPLVANYFPGYDITWTGAAVGFAWSVFAFGVAGWFCAFVRNFVLATSVWITRTREDLRASHGFLDHI